MNMKDIVAIVTRSESAIGRATAIRLAAEGVKGYRQLQSV